MRPPGLEFQFLLRILGLVGMMLAVAHLIGCIWLYIGRANMEDDTGWMWDSDDSNGSYAIKDLLQIRDEERDSSQYTDAYYFVLVTRGGAVNDCAAFRPT